MRRAVRRCVAKPAGRLALWLCAGLPVAAGAVEIEHIEVRRDGERYSIRVAARLDAPAEQAFAVMTDYERLPAINDSVQRVRRLSTAAEGEDIYTEVRLCVALLCKQLWQVQNMRQAAAGSTYTLTATVNPALSNLKSGTASWRFEACSRRQTCLDFQAELVPDFWVPPLIGPWAIQHTMRREAIATCEGIERLAGVRRP